MTISDNKYITPKKEKLRALSGENINPRFTLNDKQLHNPTQRIYKKHQKKTSRNACRFKN